MKNNITIFLFVSVLSSTVLAYELNCRFTVQTDWWAIDRVYFCDLLYNIQNSTNNDVVTELNGSHLTNKSNADVVGFRANDRDLEYFPKGLPKYFHAEKMRFIAVWSTGLKEIHQNDLSPFTNLQVLSLYDNDFEVIERDLLKFNPLIEYIGLGKNKIKFIDGNVFGHLKRLSSLHIDGNKCISSQVVDDKEAVIDLLIEIKEKCSSSNATARGKDFNLDVRTST